MKIVVLCGGLSMERNVSITSSTLICRALRELDYRPTVFIVSQRTSSIRFADSIVTLDEGRVAGVGTHDALLETCPVYREIYDSQFRKEARA